MKRFVVVVSGERLFGFIEYLCMDFMKYICFINLFEDCMNVFLLC